MDVSETVEIDVHAEDSECHQLREELQSLKEKYEKTMGVCNIFLEYLNNSDNPLAKPMLELVRTIINPK